MRRCFRVLAIVCCMCLLMVSFSFGTAENEMFSIKEGNFRDQYVRVLLTRLANRERLDITLTGPYQLKLENGNELYFHAGNQLTFQVRNDSVYLYYHEMSQNIGHSFSLTRVSSDAQKQGFQVTNFPELYIGDLMLGVSGGKLRPVLRVHVEDYLLGVVPYEMGESFPLEALKAQAITARTYALRCQGRYKDYDLVDNTNDQAFKGYIEGHAKSEQAVKETRGLCGYYKGDLAQCYYAASNGGQTELVQTVWEGREAYPYYASVEDPYDIANPQSTVRSLRLLKEYTKDQEAPLKLRQLLAEQIVELLDGHAVTPEDIRVDSVLNVRADNPSTPGSKRMTRLHLEARLSIRGYIDRSATAADMSPEEVYLFPDTNELPALTTIAEPERFNGTSSEYHPLKQPVRIDLPIFPVAEQGLALSINSNYQNEIWNVRENENEFVIEVRRYGHGVGMSQRGAQWMAEEHGMTYQDILAFYYPGMNLIRFPAQERKYAMVEEALSATVGPAPSPTPRPTTMPLTQKAEKGQWIAVVTEIADDSSLNLRAEPGLNSEILMRLYKGQRVLVVERSSEEGWVKIQTDVVQGYVMESYLTKEKQQN